MQLTPEIIDQLAASFVYALGGLSALFVGILGGMHRYIMKPFMNRITNRLERVVEAQNITSQSIAIHTEKFLNTADHESRIDKLEKQISKHNTAITNLESDLKEFKTRKIN